MNGIQFTKKLKALNSFKHIPIIMQTGAVLNENIKESLKLGVYYYLTKPYDETVLLAVIEATICNIEASDRVKQKLTMDI